MCGGGGQGIHVANRCSDVTLCPAGGAAPEGAGSAAPPAGGPGERPAAAAAGPGLSEGPPPA